MSAAAPVTSLDLDRYLTAAGAAAASFARLWQSLWDQPYASPALLEMSRLTLARLHRDPAEQAAPNPHVPGGLLTPETRQLVLAGELSSPLLQPLQRAVLQFTECYGLDPQAIPDELAESVKCHLGEAGLVFLIEALGCLDGRIRAARVLRGLRSRSGAENVHVP